MSENDYPRCATCRHWTSCEDDVNASNAVYDSPPFYSKADMIGWGVCWLCASDDMMALGTLATTPTFGCIAHEPKEQTP
jgi:hypothetical protein